MTLTHDLASDLHQELLVDRLCAIGTIRRRYGLSTTEATELVRMAGGRTHLLTLEAVRNQPRTASVYTMVTLERRMASRAPTYQGHYAGIAETRLNIGAPHHRWIHETTRSQAHARSVWTYPDAYWALDDGREAWIEYDRGAYGPKIRHRKFISVLQFGPPYIWADPSPSRLTRVKREINAYFEAQNELERRRGSTRRYTLDFQSVRVAWHPGSRADLKENGSVSPASGERIEIWHFLN